MSRQEEVKAEISAYCSDGDTMQIGCLRTLARTLAAEVDARDEVITKLLAMLRPKGEPMKYMLGDQMVDHEPAARVYARALEIAWRAE